MFGSLRKFSGSIYAKILLGIVIIPFVFWGMGSTFKGGSQNIIVEINKEKHLIDEFASFIEKFAPQDRKINSEIIENLLSNFIGEKLIEQETQYFKINISDKSLSKLIKHQKDFKRNNNFSRVEYEKFLIKNNITAANFENNLAQHEKRKQLMEFIGGGIKPPKFLVNIEFDKFNQKRNVSILNLNDIFQKNLNFTEKDVQTYYGKNKQKYNEVFKSIKFLELHPKSLTNKDEFDDLFFKKIDEIDDLTTQGKNLDHIIEKFNLKNANYFSFNILGKGKNLETLNIIPKNLITDIFEITEDQKTVLIEKNNSYFVIEIVKTENVQRKITDNIIKKDILVNLKKNKKRKLIAKIISKINQKSFNKLDFEKLSKDENIPIKKIQLKNLKDNNFFKEELVEQIYNLPKKKVVMINDINLTQNFLVYIDKITNVSVNKNSEEYDKYLNLSKLIIANRLYDTYDYYIKKKYEIKINYKALDTVKNYYIN